VVESAKETVKAQAMEKELVEVESAPGRSEIRPGVVARPLERA
jgi:hypothetical protein